MNRKNDGVLTSSSPKPVDLNTASRDELIALPGVGKVMAARIAAGRPFESIEDLASTGVPTRVIEMIRGLVDVNRQLSPEELGWPPDFFEKTAGAWLGDFVRDQGVFEEREEL